MASVVFRRNASSAYADCYAERTWQIPATGDVGQATIELPYSSAAAASSYIDPAGGSWVEIADEGGVGRWVGIVREINYDATSLSLSLAQPWVMLGDRVLRSETTYRQAMPVGYLAGIVLREGLAGLPWLWSRYLPSAAGPLIRNYSVNGQDVWSALLDLMDQSQAEVCIDAETGEVTWNGALAGDLRQTTLLVADGNFRDWSYRTNGTERAAEVIVKRGSSRLSVYNGTVAKGYPSQVMVTADDGQSLYGVAQAELARRSSVNVTVTGGVPSDLFGIRERDFVRVLLPQANLGGVEHVCRVLSRTVSDDSALMALGLQVIDEALGVIVAPPMRGASSGASGASGRGSFAQRQRATARQAWRVWLNDH
ncbi:MAG: hypothetical protein NAOJABEB_02984 [Steroidobacteraceae bacterium]|nr:hypothetical protein [Steroidobacteraceae bacterium]